jgi:hypothetical protein
LHDHGIVVQKKEEKRKMTIVQESIDNSYIEFVQIHVVETNRESKIIIQEANKTIYKKYFK